MRPSHFPGWGRPFEFNAQLLRALQRDEEARDSVSLLEIGLMLQVLQGQARFHVDGQRQSGQTPAYVEVQSYGCWPINHCKLLILRRQASDIGHTPHRKTLSQISSSNGCRAYADQTSSSSPRHQISRKAALCLAEWKILLAIIIVSIAVWFSQQQGSGPSHGTYAGDAA